MTAIQQGARALLPPGPESPDPVELRPAPSPAARQGHHSMVAAMVRDFELQTERLNDLEEIPWPLLARYARALCTAEQRLLARVRHLEESTE